MVFVDGIMIKESCVRFIIESGFFLCVLILKMMLKVMFYEVNARKISKQKISW